MEDNLPDVQNRDPGEQPARKRSAGRDLPIAIVVGLSLAGLVLGTLYTSRIAWFAVVWTVVTVGLYEFFRTVKSKGYAPAQVLGLVACLAMMAGSAWRGPRAISFVLVLLVIATFLWYLADAERKNVLANVSVTILGVVYTGLMGAHVTMMRDLPDGPAVTISFIGLVAFYDIGAYASGSFFGKHKIAPRISPGKTWEGAAGATVFVFATSLIAGPFIGRWTFASAAAMAAATCVLAPLGDLAESLLKRDLGVKDFGHILPGHGGILDRIDALLLTAPFVYWIARWLTA
jgi:phosphatidate cytidylyltransferase